MTITYARPLDANFIYNKIQEEIDSERFNYALWKKVEALISQFEGKQINKRIETALKKVLPDYIVSYDTSYGMYHIRIWGNGIEYSESKSYLLGYSGNPVIIMENVFRYNQCWELESARADNKSKITFGECIYYVNKWNTALEEMKETQAWADSHAIGYQSYGFKLE